MLWFDSSRLNPHVIFLTPTQLSASADTRRSCTETYHERYYMEFFWQDEKMVCVISYVKVPSS